MSKVTKRALEQSLKNLLLKKPLTKITIGDITEDCGINRMTFYYHFKDIYWMRKRLMTPGSRDFCRSLRQSRKTNRLS